MSIGRSTSALATLAWLLLAAAVASAREHEPDVRGFQASKLPDYTIITHDESKVGAVPAEVARIDDVLRRTLNRPEHVPSAPTFIALLPDDLFRRYLEPGPAISGEFIAGRFANYIIIRNPGDPSLVGDQIKHQYTHWFLHTQTGGAHPLWIDEGLAVLMELADIRGTKAILGYSPGPEINDVVQDPGKPLTHSPEPTSTPGWIPLKQLFRLDKYSPEYRLSTWSSNVHFESWALVHRALIFDEKFNAQVYAYLDALTAGQSIDDAVKAGFGVPLDDLDSSIYSYAGIGKVVQLDVAPARAVRLPPGNPMAKPAALGFIADIMLASGFHADRLREVADALQRSAPESAATFALRMRIAALERDDATLERMSRDLRTAAPEFARGAGLALFERVYAPDAGTLINANQELLTTRAYELLQTAVQSQPEDAEPAWAAALLAARLRRDLPRALLHVQALSARMPYSAELRIAVATLLGASGATDEMRQSLTEARRLSMSSRDRQELEALLASAATPRLAQ